METAEEQTLTCIKCPLGCQVTVAFEAGKIVKVSGNTCRRGEIYARQECTNPTRIVTSSVPVRGSGICPMVSVKTAEPVPKDRIFDVMAALAQVSCTAPVHIGDVVLKDVAGTGVDIVATRNV